MSRASPTKQKQQVAVKYRYTTISETKKLWYLDVVFSDAYPIASWVETGVEGSTLAIRLQRPFVMIQNLPKKIK